MERSYTITLYAPLGEKHGVMFLQINGIAVNGFLSILGKKQPYQGTLDANGNCILFGELHTPVRTISYTAKGKVDEDAVELILQGERETMCLCGAVKTPSRGEGV